jgi:hypothetical protein
VASSIILAAVASNLLTLLLVAIEVGATLEEVFVVASLMVAASVVAISVMISISVSVSILYDQ